jgi:hypothetical protein
LSTRRDCVDTSSSLTTSTDGSGLGELGQLAWKRADRNLLPEVVAEVSQRHQHTGGLELCAWPTIASKNLVRDGRVAHHRAHPVLEPRIDLDQPEMGSRGGQPARSSGTVSTGRCASAGCWLFFGFTSVDRP